MRIMVLILFVALFAGGTTIKAQSVDVGRGKISVVLPTGYDGSPVPLVVLLHGYTMSGQRQDAYFDLSGLVDEYGFALVAPDGTMEEDGNKSRFWNASQACCDFEKQGVDDSAYVARLIEAVKEVATIDARRVSLVGHSNGGFMAYRLAHDHSEVIAAIVSLAGVEQTEERPAPPRTVHVLQIHGTSDATIDYGGGEIQDVSHPGARASVERWAGYNGCSRAARESGTLDLDRDLPGAETTVSRYTDGCAPGGSAELWRIEGGAHAPALSPHFSRLVVEWLLGHPKR